jgi:hypothetical protein
MDDHNEVFFEGTEALKPPANMGAMVGGGVSGATSRLALNNCKQQGGKDEKGHFNRFYLCDHSHDVGITFFCEI